MRSLVLVALIGKLGNHGERMVGADPIAEVP